MSNKLIKNKPQIKKKTIPYKWLLPVLLIAFVVIWTDVLFTSLELFLLLWGCP